MTDKGRTNERISEKGLTALELLIAMAVFLVVMASVYGMLRVGNMSRSTINKRSENIKNVRAAINTIGREAVNAGLGYNRIGGTVPDDFTTFKLGLPPDPDGVHDLLTAISTGVNINQSSLSKEGKNDVVAFAFRDFQFNNGFPIVIKDVYEDNGKLILKTPDGACANCRPYDLFLLEAAEGKQAVILSTNIVNNNAIVLGGGPTDPLDINYGPTTSGGGSGGGSSDDDDDDDDDDDKAEKGEDSNGYCLPGHYGHLHCLDPIGLLTGLLGGGGGGSGGSSTATSGSVQNSTVKKCSSTVTQNCINYNTTSVVVKKIYLVSYSVSSDGTLVRTTFANNTGAGAEEQVVSQPIASGVRSFKIKYLLSDGTVTEDPSVANTQKERCNEIIQIEVSATVDSDASNGEPITLTSTFSTRNLKYDVY